MEEHNLILTMPVLPLRGLTAFPGTILNFDVERPMSIAALNDTATAYSETHPFTPKKEQILWDNS